MDVIKLFSELVFPVAVTVYLLVNTTQKIEKLTDIIRELREEIRVMYATLSHDKKEGA